MNFSRVKTSIHWVLTPSGTHSSFSHPEVGLIITFLLEMRWENNYKEGGITCPLQGRTGASPNHSLPLGLMALASAVLRGEAASLFFWSPAIIQFYMRRCSINISWMNSLREAAPIWHLRLPGDFLLSKLQACAFHALHPLRVDTLILFLPGDFPSAVDWTVPLPTLQWLIHLSDPTLIFVKDENC